jgi:uncharacterized protein YyaL (SSP411 family)
MKKTNYNFKSVLEQIINNVYEMKDVNEAKNYITNFLEEKKIDEVTKKQMLQNLYDGMETYGSGYSNWGLLLLRFLAEEKQMHVLNESNPNFVYKATVKSNCLLSYHQQLPFSQLYPTDAISVCEYGVCHKPVQSIEEALKF